MIFNSDIMNFNVKSAVGYLTFKDLEDYSFINHAFSTRLGGVSRGIFKSMNFGFSNGDRREKVVENYRQFCNAVGFDFTKLVLSAQTHSDNIRIVHRNDAGVGIWKPQDMNDVDGLVTNERGLTLVTFHADCASIFLIDPEKEVIGLAHAGWRGTVKKIAIKIIEKMCDNFNCNVSDIICCIGPYIGKCCFEIGKEILPNFEKLGIDDLQYRESKHYPDKVFIDLAYINKKLLLQHGIKRENIIVSDICTSCNSDLLFSHRATNGKRGVLAAMISLK